jgi:hypothetical protein
MSDVETEEEGTVLPQEGEEPMPEEASAPPANGETPTMSPLVTAATVKRPKDPVPDGWCTPVQLMHIINAKYGTAAGGVDIRPQIIYGFVKNSKDFPHKKNTDGAVIVPKAEALAWYEQLLVRRVDRQNKKAAEAAATAAQLAPQPAPQSESPS